MAITPRRTIETAAFTFETSRPDVFAAGDAASGPASAIQAIAGGTRGSLLDGPLPARRPDPAPTAPPSAKPWTRTGSPAKACSSSPRNERAVTDAPGFGERRRGLDLHAVLAEGMRCMTCGAKARIAYNDDCMTCFTCELRCPAEAINVHPFKEPPPRTLEIHCED